MTLDETILHLEEVIPTIECQEYREDHVQLLEWLRDYRNLTQEPKLEAKCKMCGSTRHKTETIKKYEHDGWVTCGYKLICKGCGAYIIIGEF